MSQKHGGAIAYNIWLYCWILATVTAYGFGVQWSALLAAAGCVALLVRLASDADFRRQAAPMPIDYFLLVLWLVALAGTTTTIYFHNTLQSFINLTSLIAIYYVLRLSLTGHLQHVGIWMVGAVASLLLALVTIGETIYFHIVLASYHLGNASNLRAFFNVPVAGGSASERLSVLLALLPFPVLVSVEFWRKNRGISILGIASAFLLAVSAVLTLSRGMYIGLGVFAIVLFSLLLRYSSIPRRQLVFIAGLCVIVIYLAVIPWQRSVVTTALMDRTSVQVRSAQGRMDLWKMYAAISKAHPAFGIGGGNLGLIPVHLQGRTPAEGYVFASAFNTAIMLLVEDGVVGLCCYLLLLAWFLLSALRYLRKGLQELDLLEMALCLAAILSLCVRDLTACSILTQPITSLLVCIMAALAGRRPVNAAAQPAYSVTNPFTAKMPRMALSGVAGVFLVALCALAWRSIGIARAESSYEDCATDLAMGDLASARSAMDDAVHFDPRNALYIAARGLANATVLDAVPFSWPIEDAASHLTPDRQSALRSAAADYESVVRLNSADALAWHNLGWLYFYLGNSEQALNALNRSASLEPTEWTTQVSLGLQLEARGRMPEAFAAYRDALMLNPQLVDTQFFAELQRRHPDLAGQSLSQALAALQQDMTVGHSPILAAKAAKLALFKKDLPLASTDLEFATQQMPLLYRAWLNLATVYTLQGKTSEAKHCFDIAEMINPVDVEMLKRQSEKDASSGDTKVEQTGFDVSHPQQLQGFGQFSDRNVRLSRQYLSNPLINNNVVPQGLLPYAQ